MPKTGKLLAFRKAPGRADALDKPTPVTLPVPTPKIVRPGSTMSIPEDARGWCPESEVRNTLQHPQSELRIRSGHRQVYDFGVVYGSEIRSIDSRRRWSEILIHDTCTLRRVNARAFAHRHDAVGLRLRLQALNAKLTLHQPVRFAGRKLTGIDATNSAVHLVVLPSIDSGYCQRDARSRARLCAQSCAPNVSSAQSDGYWNLMRVVGRSCSASRHERNTAARGDAISTGCISTSCACRYRSHQV
jgi:hypothetical protein